MRCHLFRIRVRFLRSRSNGCAFIFILLVLFVFFRLYSYHQSLFFQSVFQRSYGGFEKFLFSNYTAHRERFIPGKYLESFSPHNLSFCNFRFSLPNSLDIPGDEVRFPPELDTNSDYRVVYDVLQTKAVDKINITLCTHATPEFIYYLAELLKRWEGPVSIASYVPGTDAGILICLLENLCHCLPDMSRVSLHFVYPAEFPPELTECTNSLIDCTPPLSFLKSLQTFRNSKDLAYPINVARNAARTRANTSFILVSDIELFPSRHLVSKFISMMTSLRSKSKTNFDVFLNRIVYVIPVFEIEWYEQIPSLKSQLLDLYAQNKAFYFHRWVCSHCQRFPGLQRWLLRKKKNLDTSIEPFFVVRREYPFHRWEPVFIGTNSEPFYSELLSWEGQQDKMTQMHEMCLLEYRFVILDGAFMVHSPGVKRKTDKITWRSDMIAANSKRYDRIIERMGSRLKHNPRCRRH